MKSGQGLYDNVSNALRASALHSGPYCDSRIDQLTRNKISIAEFVDAMQFSLDKQEETIADLRLIRFPNANQRKSLDSLIEAIETFKRGIEAYIDTAKNKDGRWYVGHEICAKATKATDAYWEAARKDEIEWHDKIVASLNN